MKYFQLWDYCVGDNLKKEEILPVPSIEAEAENFEVQLGSFSGPLDLLCHLVESREMDPAKLNITELVSQYVNFLLNSKRTSLNELAEFFSFVSRLLLRKVRSLFPASLQEEAPYLENFDEGYIQTEDDLRRLLEEFIPYRKATSLLKRYQQERERSFNRVFDEDSSPFYDLGDLYGLASRWWQLLDEYHQRLRNTDFSEDDLWEDIPDAIPEERQVEERMDELLQQLKSNRLKLSEILYEKNKKFLIVTLLALLEMSRLGMINLVQQKTWGDVEIAAG